MWTFGKKIALGFAACFVLLLLVAGVAYRSLETLTQASDWVRHSHEVIARVDELYLELKNVESGVRGFLLTGDETFLESYRKTLGGGRYRELLKALRQLTADNPSQQRQADAIEAAVSAYMAFEARLIEQRGQAGPAGLEAASRAIQAGGGMRLIKELQRLVQEYHETESDLLKKRAEDVEAAAGSARATLIGGTVLSLGLVVAAGLLITRSLTRQIAGAVQHVQRSSNELQSAANQQAAGARESSTAMTEITTTISELLATSRQIAESAQRVAGVAEQTTQAARAGEGTVDQAQDSINAIREQVDRVVTHMLELGRKSQQIGVVLDIVSELAEQTNILAINATIEATGAGESGRRFGVVADEIRKLADRVTSATKEIRTLIDDVRGAVNTTVMATETGAKAVEAGTRQFGDVTAAFKRIAALVVTTTEATREIVLSTKQQATAVEQVNVAISNTAQATRETEASSGQTFQTASQLAGLSKDLLRLVQPQAVA